MGIGSPGDRPGVNEQNPGFRNTAGGMTTTRFEIRSWPRPIATFLDDALGEVLVERLRSSLAAGATGSAPLVVRGAQIDLVRWDETGDVPFPVRMAMLAMTDLGEAGGAEAVGVLGLFGGQRAAVFLEWPDCRWWLWEARVAEVDGGRCLVEDSVRVRRAVDGVPMPDGVGRWWSLGRRLGFRGALERAADASAGRQVVH